MVHQVSNRNVIDLEVCSISYQRHCTSLLKKRSKITNNLCKKPVMADNTDRHPLPVVELRPFTKKVWRREKSLPDFYERKRTDEGNTSSSNTNNGLEIDTSSGRLVRELTETRKNIETRQGTIDSALGKYRNHPKAEFLHESNKAWRKQDLIPSFITRFERTKTSLEALSKENTIHNINFENTSMFENALRREPNPMIKIKGGKMSQQIQRRHFLYLNPLDTYRQPNSWVPHFNSTNNSRQNTTRDKLLLSSRHSIPLTSSRTRDLLLGDSQAQYPLKPIRREDAESPHKFNNKLGAAKNSLEVLSKIGIQTRLEKNLEKEIEWNMEKFRKDRHMFTNDLKGVPFQCFNVESNLTLGEMSLKSAREANKLAKGKQRQKNARRINALGGDMTGGDVFNSCTPDDEVQCHPNSSVVNPVLHPIGHPLVEETETYAGPDSTLVGTHKLVGRGRDLKQTAVVSESKDIELSGDNLLQSNTASRNSIGNEDLSSSNNAKLDNQSTMEINNNNDTVISKERERQVIDSSRIETNVAYLENLQLKSAQGYRPSNNTTPVLNLTQIDSTPSSGSDRGIHTPSNNDKLSPSQQSMYTSHNEQSLLQTQRASPHSVANSPSSQQNGLQKVDEQSTELQNKEIGSQKPHLSNQQPNKVSSANEIRSEHQPVAESSESSRTIQDSTDIKAEDDGPNTIRAESEAVPIQGSRRQPVAEINNSSPLTSSGFESQTTTDQEDELSPSSDQRVVFPQDDVKEKSEEDEITDKTVVNDVDVPHQPTNEASHPKGVITDSDQTVIESDQHRNTVLHGDKPQNENKDAIENVDDEKEIIVAKDNNNPSSSRNQTKMATQYSPEVDEGIGLVPTEAAVLDSSVTEVCSDQGLTGCADNGDSGVSTTFLTSEDSVPEALEGVAMS